MGCVKKLTISQGENAMNYDLHATAMEPLVSAADKAQADYLLHAARECDRLRRRIIETAEDYARDVALYAATLTTGAHRPFPSRGHLDQDAATYADRRATLLTLVGVLLGADARAAYLAAMPTA